MLFNSYDFIFAFLPIVLAGYQIAGMVNRKFVIAWLALSSLVFYAHWNPAFLIVLLGSILFNYFAGALIARRFQDPVCTKRVLWSAIACNLAALCYFKYLFVLLTFVAGLAGKHLPWASVALPLGISFFTFTQIAYLVDLQQGIAEQRGFMNYVLFVSFFPHLIAGPILHHKEMMPQFEQNRRYRLRADDLTVGFSWFIMGLVKKVLIADMFAASANAVYAATEPLSLGAAWRGALCYALQLYFDFSGYSDMALGLARMLSIDFPLNFNSPYKAASIIDFWQRWHMTLSRYIGDYLYSPTQLWVRSWRRERGLPVNRSALNRPSGFLAMVAFPTLFTMLIAGIWHGAGLQFIVFGVLHGVYITINHYWRMIRGKKVIAGETAVTGRYHTVLVRVSSVTLTFLSVMVAQIFFRAAGVRQAISFLAALIGFHPTAARSPGLFQGEIASHTAIKMVLGFAIVWLLPNTQEILKRFRPSLEDADVKPARPAILLWSPDWVWASLLAVLFVVCLVYAQNASTFLYFQF